MGIFFPGNWSFETLVPPLLVLACAVVLLALSLARSFFRPALSLEAAREQAGKTLERITKGLEQSAKNLQGCKEHQSRHLDKVLELAQEHIRENITRDEAARLTTDAVTIYEWGYVEKENLARTYIEIHQSAAERTEAAQLTHDETQSLHDDALALQKELQQHTNWSYRKDVFKNRKWRAFFKGILRATLWFSLLIYGFGVADTDIRTWTQDARSAVGQDETVVEVTYNFGGVHTVTIDRDGCQMTFPVDVRSSTDYEFTGDGAVHLRVSKDGNVSPCMELLRK